MTEMFINTQTGTYHTDNCVRINRYKHHSKYKLLSEVTEEEVPNKRHPCPLCRLDITPETGSFVQAGINLLNYGTSTDIDHETITDCYRTLTTVTEDLLVELGDLEENTGAEVITRGKWKRRHSMSDDVDDFEEALYEAVQTHLLFYYWFHKKYQELTWGEFRKKTRSDDIGLGPEKRVSRTVKWLVKERGHSGIGEQVNAENEALSTETSEQSADETSEPSQNTSETPDHIPVEPEKSHSGIANSTAAESHQNRESEPSTADETTVSITTTINTDSETDSPVTTTTDRDEQEEDKQSDNYREEEENDTTLQQKQADPPDEQDSNDDTQSGQADLTTFV